MKTALSFFCRVLPSQALVHKGRALILFLLLCVCLTPYAFAQKVIWDKTFGGDKWDELTSLQQTRDGGYILGGGSGSDISGDKSEVTLGNCGENCPFDYWIIKLKADGTKEWDKTIGGDGYDYLSSVQQTSDGGYILGGHSDSNISGDKTEAKRGSGKFEYDYWIVKLDAQGKKEWDKTLGGSGQEWLTSLQQTSDGGYLLGGSSNSGKTGDKSDNRKNICKGSSCGTDYWIVKLKANGTKEWDKTLGGDNFDKLNSLHQTKEGGYILGGSSDSGKSGDKSEATKGAFDYWLIKLNAAGTTIWDKTIGGAGADELMVVQQTSDDAYILGGSSASGTGGDKSEPTIGLNYSDYWVVKLDAGGSKVWDKTYGGQYHDNLVALQQTTNGDYILGGRSRSDISGDKTDGRPNICEAPDVCEADYWLIKLSADGSKIWDKTLGGNREDCLTSVQETSDGSYLIGGYSNSGHNGDKTQNTKGNFDFWIIKLDNSQNQSITFAPILDKTLEDAPFFLSAAASSGLPVTFSVESGPATVKGNRVALLGIGTVIIKAFQAGDAVYKPVESTQTFLIEAPSVVKKQWNKTIGGEKDEVLQFIQQTTDGGYILGGGSYSGISGDKSEDNRGKDYTIDYWVVKLQADGSKAWDKTFGGNYQDVLVSLQQTSDGGYILGGTSSSGVNGDKTEANKACLEEQGCFNDFWIVKINAVGSKEWDRTIGGDGSDNLASLQLTKDGGYILGGYSESGISGDKSEAQIGNKDYWVVKIRSNGAIEWDKTIGGNDEDELKALQQTSDSGYILGGESYSGISGDKTEASKGSYDYWVVKLDASGKKLWDKTVGSIEIEELTSLQQTSDGGYILGGSSSANKSGDKTEDNKGGKGNFFNDYWVVKLRSNGTIEWDKTIGGDNEDWLESLQQTKDGNYILGGSSNTSKSGDKSEANKGAKDEYGIFATDYWLVMLKNDGSKLWDKTIGGENEDRFASLQQTRDAGYILGGTSLSGIGSNKSEAFKGGDYHGDYWIVKLKAEQPLTVQWDKRYGGSGKDDLTSVIKTSDGGYLTGGYSASGVGGDKSQGSQGKNDYWIVKSDQNGKKLWDKRYGGSEDEYLNRIIQTQDGGYLLGGSSLSGKSGDKTEASQGERDYWVVKVDKQGNSEWDKTYGGSGEDELIKVVQLPTGEYVLGGSSNSLGSGDKSQSSQGSSDYWLVKIKADGTKLWDKRYGGSEDDFLGGFTESTDSGFFLGGSSLSGKSGDKTQANRGEKDYWAVKTDKEGNLLWEKTYGGTGADQVYSVGRSHGDNLYLAGTSDSGKEGDKSQESQGGKDYWLIKLDENGAKLWDKSFGGSKDDELRASSYTDAGHYILAGSSYSDKSGDKTQASQGASDYWVVEVNEQGSQVQDQRFGGNREEELRTVFQTPDGGLLLAGTSDSGISGDRTQPSQGDTDYWLVKVAPVTSSIVVSRKAGLAEEPVKNEPNLLLAYSNPFQKRLQVSFTLPETQLTTVKVFDLQGREIATLFQDEAQANQIYGVEWHAGDKSSGMYLLQLQTSTKRYQHKILLAR